MNAECSDSPSFHFVRSIKETTLNFNCTETRETSEVLILTQDF